MPLACSRQVCIPADRLRFHPGFSPKGEDLGGGFRQEVAEIRYAQTLLEQELAAGQILHPRPCLVPPGLGPLEWMP